MVRPHACLLPGLICVQGSTLGRRVGLSSDESFPDPLTIGFVPQQYTDESTVTPQKCPPNTFCETTVIPPASHLKCSAPLVGVGTETGSVPALPTCGCCPQQLTS